MTTLSDALVNSAYKLFDNYNVIVDDVRVNALRCILVMDKSLMAHTVLTRVLRHSAYYSDSKIKYDVIAITFDYLYKNYMNFFPATVRGIMPALSIFILQGMDEPKLKTFFNKHKSQLKEIFLYANERDNSLSRVIAGLTIENSYYQFLYLYAQQIYRNLIDFFIFFDRFDIVHDFEQHMKKSIRKYHDYQENVIYYLSRIHLYKKHASVIQRNWRKHSLRKLKLWIAKICYAHNISPTIGFVIYSHT